MITVMLLALAAAVALSLSMALKLPSAPMGILVGVALRLFGAPLEPVLLWDGLLLAATLLVFIVGAEIESRHARHFRGPSVGIALAQLVLIGLVAVPLGSWLGKAPVATAYLVLAMGASSTLVVVEILRRREGFFEPGGRLAVGVVQAQDVVIIIALALLGAVEGTAVDVATMAGAILALGGVVVVCLRWVAPVLLVDLGLDEEEQLLVVLALLFLFVGGAWFAGLPPVVGALFAGLALGRFPTSGLVRGHLTTFSDFFTATFFVALGAVVPVPDTGTLAAELLFLAALLVVRPLLLLPLVRRAGRLTVRASLEVVALLAQTGELAIVAALVGLQRGHLTEESVGIVVTVAIVTMATVPWLSSERVTWGLTRWHPGTRPTRLSTPPSGHLLLLGCGEGGMALLDALGAAALDVVVVDDDPAVVARLEGRGVRVVRGDAADPELLEAGGADRATAIVSTMRRLSDHERLLRAIPRGRVLVRVFSEAEAEQVRALGGRPIVESDLVAEAVLRWATEVGERAPAPA